MVLFTSRKTFIVSRATAHMIEGVLGTSKKVLPLAISIEAAGEDTVEARA